MSRNRYLPYYVGPQPTKIYGKGAATVFPIGNLGMKAVLTPAQFKKLIDNLKYNTPIEDEKPGSPVYKAMLTNSKKSILEYYNNLDKPKVKRTKANMPKPKVKRKVNKTYTLKDLGIKL